MKQFKHQNIPVWELKHNDLDQYDYLLDDHLKQSKGIVQLREMDTSEKSIKANIEYMKTIVPINFVHVYKEEGTISLYVDEEIDDKEMKKRLGVK